MENETTGTTIRYQYDGAGNRIRAIGGSQERQFLVAPSMGGGLQSTDLIADGNGNLLSNYVYAGGHTPFMRIDADGNPIYYLTDAMGSVIGLANGTGAEVGDFRYDSFGNLRGGTPTIVEPMGGDFRFQGQWLEAETGLYHFRARDYNAQTGTFLSRDPIDIIETEPESFNPYQFVYNNPHVYSDPTGMFSIQELNTTQSVQQILQQAQSYAVSHARQYFLEQARGAVGDILNMALTSFLPGAGIKNYLDGLPSRFDQGDDFEDLLKDSICSFLRPIGGPLYDNLWLGYPVSYRTGQPSEGGINCDTPGSAPRGRSVGSTARPDFIFKKGEPTENHMTGKSYPKAWVIGDVALSWDRVKSKVRPNETQWKSIYKHAQYESRFQYAPLVLYISLKDGTQADLQSIRREAAAKNVLLNLITLFD